MTKVYRHHCDRPETGALQRIRRQGGHRENSRRSCAHRTDILPRPQPALHHQRGRPATMELAPRNLIRKDLNPGQARGRWFQPARFIAVDVAKARVDPAQFGSRARPAGASPVRMTISPDGGRIFVTARASNAVLIFDTGKLVTDPDHARLATVRRIVAGSRRPYPRRQNSGRRQFQSLRA